MLAPAGVSSAGTIGKKTIRVISEDIFWNSFRTRLVSIAALLRRYSPLLHLLLRLLGHVPALLSVTNYELSALYECVQGTKLTPRELKQDPPKNVSFDPFGAATHSSAPQMLLFLVFGVLQLRVCLFERPHLEVVMPKV